MKNESLCEVVLEKLNLLYEHQQELMMLMKAMKLVLPDAVPEEEVWLTKAAVMDLLCITSSTFYRRLAEYRWERKKSGGTWYYLRSDLFK
ncbi:hypothetical protein [Pedobacter frigoris]|uniref:hypothetical protein n=1 Tax=Pedobacter frigoris TaxID=2571272 RepID=UPI002931A7CD|nr:hypothetical protein [Pedobacter frigoris]